MAEDISTTVSIENIMNNIRLKRKQKVASVVAPQNIAAPADHVERPLQLICYDILSAYGVRDPNEGDTRLKALKEELKGGKSRADNVLGGKKFTLNNVSNGELKRLLELQRKRVSISNAMENACIAAVAQVSKKVSSDRERMKSWLKKREQTIEAKRQKWNNKADQLAKKHGKIVSENRRVVEGDWNNLVGRHQSLKLVGGGGSTLERLEMAKTFGVDPTESTIGRAKAYERSKSVHESVHWGLRNAVEKVTDAYAAESRENTNDTIFNATNDTINNGHQRIRDAIAEYNVADAPLKYETEILQQGLNRQGITTVAVMSATLEELVNANRENRATLQKLL